MLQKPSPSSRRVCTELVEAGWNPLAPMGDGQVTAATILNARGMRGKKMTPHGDDGAACMIVAELLRSGG